MANRIDKKFRELKKGKRKAFIAYITAGDPSLSVTERMVLELEGSGADLVELGIPFSDPLADGLTIQAASQRALEKGVNLKKIFRMVGSLRKKTAIPIIFMTYYNPVLKYGLNRFVTDCSSFGVDGVIIPDLPYEEAGSLRRLADKKRIATIFLIAPTSTTARMRHIAKFSRGFIYYVSLAGVTGARKRLPQDILSKVRTIKSMTKAPVAVGFGISNSDQAKSIARFADGVIVGSAIVKLIEKYGRNQTRLLSELSKFSKSLAKAIHGA